MLYFIKIVCIQSVITINFQDTYLKKKTKNVGMHIAPWLGEYAHQKGLHWLDSDVKQFTFDLCTRQDIIIKSI